MRKLLTMFLGLLLSFAVIGCDESEVATETSVETVTLNKSVLSLAVEATANLTVTVAPADADNQKVNWKSSDSDVATVDGDGLVVAVAEGEAVITVSSDENPNITDECTVTVVSVAVPVESVSLNKNTLELNAGDKETLEATVEPEDADIKTVTWSSSNEEVATVSEEGEVVAIAAGEATITVVSDENSELKAECVVTVSEVVEGSYTLANIDAENLPAENVWVISDASAEWGVRANLQYPAGGDRPTSYDGNGDFYNLYMALKAAGEAGREITVQFPNLTTLPQFAFFDVENEISGTKDYLTGLVAVEFPKVTVAGEEALAFCKTLRSAKFDILPATSRILFYNCSALENVELPSLTFVYAYTFYGCSALKSLSLPLATQAGTAAFYEAKGLESIEMPNLSALGAQAFQDCDALKSVSFPKLRETPLYAFAGCESLVSADLPALDKMEKYTFQNCTSLKSISLPNITFLPGYTFSTCVSLTDVNLPNVDYVESGAFSHCEGLKEISLPNATILELMVFWACHELESVSLPKTRYIADQTFYQNYKLTDLLVATEAKTIYVEEHAFDATTELKKVNLVTGKDNGSKIAYNFWTVGEFTFGPFKSAEFYTEPEPSIFALSEVPTDGSTIFDDVWTITDSEATSASDFANLRAALNTAGRDITVKFPSLKAIPAEAFYVGAGEFVENLVALEAKQATSLGDMALYFTVDLKSVELPKVATVGNSAFNGCEALTAVELESATTVGDNAFTGCTALMSVSLPSVTSLGAEVFNSSNTMVELYLATESESLSAEATLFDGATISGTTLYTSANNGTTVEGTTWTVGGNNFTGFKAIEVVSAEDAPIFTLANIPTDGKTITGNTWVITDANSTSSVDFSNLRDALNSAGRGIRVEFPELKSIPKEAFYNASTWQGTNNLKELDAPKVKSVGGDAFTNCCHLEVISLPSATTLAPYAIFTVEKLEELTLCVNAKAESIPVAFISLCNADTNVTLYTGSEAVTGIISENNTWYCGNPGEKEKGVKFNLIVIAD